MRSEQTEEGSEQQAEPVKETRKIFIEVLEGANGLTETKVDWNPSFTSLQDVMLTLQMAMGAVAQELQKSVQLQQMGSIRRPDFVKR